ncbi:YfhO family protein [uncultured Robinsoniella sp.]|uniref:YfhO family protein n=1 Tax=uncultured Robinsoniella sp. TaxID=904190 RepID=UPI00374FB043
MREIVRRIKKFDSDSVRNQRINYYVIYTILFIAIALACFLGFLLEGKSMIWKVDGLNQHYSSLAYFGKYLRSIITTFFSTGKLSIPLWDPHIGYGSDVINTLNYYVIGDPLNLLSVFVPASRADYLYEFLILLKMYLAGISFSAFCKMMNKGRFATLCGAFTYAFCTYALYTAGRHPFFINPMIYLPLLLIGIEKIFAKKKPYFFIVMVFISGISNFYFFYMLSILIVVYAIVRFFSIYQEHRIKNFFLCLRDFAGYYITGALMACAIFLPNALALMSSERFSIDRAFKLFYNSQYYKALPFNMLSNKMIANWTLLGCAVIVIPAVLLLIVEWKKHKELAIGFMVLSVFFMFPIIGRAMNGFSYASNRWEWGYCFLLAFILTVMLPDLQRLKKKQIAFISGAVICYLLCYLILTRNRGIDISFVPSWILLFLTVGILAAVSLKSNSSNTSMNRKSNISVYLPYISIFTVTVASIVVYGNLDYFPRKDNLEVYVTRGEAYNEVVNKQAGAASRIGDKDFNRFEILDQSPSSTATNMAMLNDVSGTSFYLSQSDSNVYNALSENANRFYHSFSYKSLDNRAMLGTLSNVKYEIVEKGKSDNIFFGYEPLQDEKTDGMDYQIYKNKYSLPFGYTYSEYITKDQFDKLSPLKRQEAMMQGAVLEQGVTDLNKSDLKFTEKEIPFEVEDSKNVTYKDGVFRVKKASSVTIMFKGAKASETYLYFEDLLFEGGNEHNSKALVSIGANGIHKFLYLLSPDRRSFEGVRDHAVNLGYSEGALTSIKIKFKNKGKYSFKDLKVICQPMDQYPAQIENLKADHLENTEFTANKISGTIDLDSSKLLCLTIPFSKGWTAYVDGKETEILRTNTMYSGILLEEGKHSVELKYFTPGLKVGLLGSAMGLISFVVILFYNKKRKRV